LCPPARLGAAGGRPRRPAAGAALQSPAQPPMTSVTPGTHAAAGAQAKFGTNVSSLSAQQHVSAAGSRSARLRAARSSGSSRRVDLSAMVAFRRARPARGLGRPNRTGNGCETHTTGSSGQRRLQGDLVQQQPKLLTRARERQRDGRHARLLLVQREVSAGDGRSLALAVMRKSRRLSCGASKRGVARIARLPEERNCCDGVLSMLTRSFGRARTTVWSRGLPVAARRGCRRDRLSVHAPRLARG